MNYIKQDKNTVKTSLGYRQSRIAKTSKMSQFSTMWGCEVDMENGDSFGIYSPIKSVIENFKPGVLLTYEYIKEIDYPGMENEKIKFRISNYHFMMPRQERFEPMVVEKICDAIFESAQLAATEGIDTVFEDRANKVYLYLKHKLLHETFDFHENDTKEIVGAEENKKTKKVKLLIDNKD